MEKCEKECFLLSRLERLEDRVFVDDANPCIQTQIEGVDVRLKRIERVIYGLAGTVAAAVVGAVLKSAGMF